MSNEFVKRGYNKAAKNYALQRNQFQNDRYLEKLSVALPAHSHILDIGCGAGIPVDKFFIDKGHLVTGIDISEKMIDLAKQNVPLASYIVGDMNELDKGVYHANAVVSFYAIFHTPRETHQHLLETFYSFLPMGGFLLVTMGSSDWEGEEPDFHGTEMFWSHYDAQRNKELVEQAGFKILIDEIDVTVGEKHQIIFAEKL